LYAAGIVNARRCSLSLFRHHHRLGHHLLHTVISEKLGDTRTYRITK
jgi:hypothetical protein